MSREIKKFNVLCVTKRRKDNRGWESWHLPIYGVAELVTDDTKGKTNILVHGIAMSTVVEVHFKGAAHKLLYVRSGIHGSAVTLAIEVHDPNNTYDVWELYTDTPTGNDSPGSIRVMAAAEVDRHAHDRRNAEEATRRLINW